MGSASLWVHNKFQDQSCEDLNQRDLFKVEQYLGKRVCEQSQDQLGRTADGAGQVAESLLFDELGRQHWDQLTCELTNIDHFAKDSSLIKVRAEEIQSKLPFLREQSHLANLKYASFQQASGKVKNLATICRTESSSGQLSCQSNLKEAKKQEDQLESEWKGHRALAFATIRGIWNGSTETMSEYLQALAKSDHNPSLDELEQGLRQQIPKVRTEFAEQKKSLEGASTKVGGKRTYNNLSDSQKAALVEMSSEAGLFKKAVESKDSAMLKLICRVEGEYTKGRAELNNVLMGSTLVVGGLAASAIKIPMLLRAGELGKWATSSRATAQTLGALATTVDTAVLVDSVSTACGETHLKYNLQHSCPASGTAYKKQELERMSEENCILAAAMAAAPVALLAGSSYYQFLKPNLKRFADIKNEFPEFGARARSKIDAERSVGRITESMTTRQGLSEQKMRENAERAQQIFKQKEVKVIEVPTVMAVDQRRLAMIRSESQRTAFEYRKVTQPLAAEFARLYETKDQLNNLIRNLQKEVYQLKRGSSDTKALAAKEIELESAQQELKKTQDELQINIQKQERYDQAYHQTLRNQMAVEKDVTEKLVPVPKFPSSIDVTIQQALARGATLSADDLAKLEATQDLRKVYTLQGVPKSRSLATSTSTFWEHPDFAGRYAETKELGVEIVIDPQKTTGAAYFPQRKAIYVSADTPYHVFEHEFTHAQFDAYIQKNVNVGGKIKPEFKAGSSLSELMPAEAVKKIGPENIAFTEDLMRKYNSTITVNESLAVKKQLEAMGWRPLHSDYYWNKVYAGFYRAKELMDARTATGLSREQSQLLDHELREISFNAAMVRGSDSLSKYWKTFADKVHSGKYQAALAAWTKADQSLQDHTKSDEAYFYNAQGQLVRLDRTSKKVELSQLSHLDGK